MTPEEQLKVLQEAKKKAEDLKTRKSKLETEIEFMKKNLDGLKKECQEAFSSSIEELPKLVQKLQQDSEEGIKKINDMLGLSTSV